jgi:hypothetical protein
MPPFLYSVKPVFDKGLGYGDASKPSFNAQVTEVGDTLVAAIKNLLRTGHVLAPVGTMKSGERVNDDGCGDGRPAVSVIEGEIKHRYSLQRPKVFGGGAMMSTAMLIGLGYADGEPLVDAFKSGMHALDEHCVNYGAHTDNHAGAHQCGCGAIDNAPVVLQNVVKFRGRILDTLHALDLGLAEEKLSEVLGNFVSYAKAVSGQQYEGKVVMNEIISKGKVVKELSGAHKELFILFNDVMGTTADQGLINDISEGKVQLFDVDLWRLKELAQKLYGATMEFEEALVSELIYTLGVAATLTHGDLPVYMAVPKEELHL